jgi:hypothetical protein
MARNAFHRYTVWLNGGSLRNSGFVGEVFQFRQSVDEPPHWMAQLPDGTVYGWLTRLPSRKAAAALLLGEAKKRGASA